MKRSTTRLFAFVSCVLFPVVGSMGQLPDRFTLGRYIPGDVFLYVNGAGNPEREWLDQQWMEVFDALRATGLERDIASLLLAKADDQGRADAKADITKWAELIHAVGWHDLMAEEIAFAERFAPGPVGAEYFLLARGKAGTVEKNMAGLVVVLKELAALSEQVTLSARVEGDATVWSLDLGHVLVPQFFRKGDIIGVVSDPGAFKEVVTLMSGRTDRAPIASAPRFQVALKKVKAPEDLVGFFDAKAFLADMDRLLKSKQAEGEDDGAEGRIAMAIATVLRMVDVVDYGIVSVETDGHRTRTHMVTELQAARRASKLASCCLDRRLFKRFDEFIPADATGFKLTGLVDVEKAYGLILDFIKHEIPGGEDMVQNMNGMMGAFGFDPQRDLFSWWSGEMISISMPPVVVTPMGGSDTVTMIRVKDPKIASEKINAGLDFLSGMLQAQGQAVLVTPTDIDGVEGFKTVTHPNPFIAMLFRPVIGVRGDWLIIGTSPAAIGKCLAVQAGKARSIRDNPRFKEEGLMPSGPVLSASFTDTSKLGHEIGQRITMAGIMGGVVAGGIEDAEEKRTVQKLMTTVMKLGPVFQKLDFFSSKASMTSYDGATTVRTESVVTYKDLQIGGAKTAKAKR